MRITLAKTVQRIAERSFVQWLAGSEGLGLVLTPYGYELTATPERFNGAALPDRVTIPREDGRPMAHGHILTDREREAAVRAILGG